MLVLSRRADESIVIQPADGVDASMTLAQLFANGPILITLLALAVLVLLGGTAIAPFIYTLF